MTTTVHVSRTFRVDTDKNPEVLEDLRLLAARGFEVFGPLDLTPVSASAPPEPEPEPKKNRVVEILAELKERSGLGLESVAVLLGITGPTVWGWKVARRPAPPERFADLERLLKRSRSLPAGSTSLRDEARGARKQRRLQASQRVSLTEDQRLAIGMMREGGATVKSIAGAFGIGTERVYKVLRELGA
jgi:hypothetical protein